MGEREGGGEMSLLMRFMLMVLDLPRLAKGLIDLISLLKSSA